MNAFALACSGICGGLGARGLKRAAARACPVATLPPTMEANAREPTPQKQLSRNSRRFRLKRTCSAILVHVKKCVQIENSESEFLHLQRIVWIAREELEPEFSFSRSGQAASRETPRVVDSRGSSLALLQQAVCERL